MTKSTIQSTFEVLNQLQQICLMIDGHGKVLCTSRRFNELTSSNAQVSKVLFEEAREDGTRVIQSVIQEKLFRQLQPQTVLEHSNNSFEVPLPIDVGYRLMAYVQVVDEGYIHGNSNADINRDSKDQRCHLMLLQPEPYYGLEHKAASSHLDCLTGLSTRWKLCAVEEKLEQTLSQKMITVAFIDLNDLKRVNDCFGHVVGDAYIKIFADLMRHYARPEDALVRYGGDEFIGVYMGMTPKLLERRIDIIQQGLLTHFNAYLENCICADSKGTKRGGSNSRVLNPRAIHPTAISPTAINQKMIHQTDEVNSIQLGFAYGIEPVTQGSTLAETIQRADKKMYAMKAQKWR